MKAARTFCPRASSPRSEDDPLAMICPGSTRSPLSTTGYWLIQVPWLVRTNFIRGYISVVSSSLVITICEPLAEVTTPGFWAVSTSPLYLAASRSIPVATIGASGRNRGTACRCMLAPIRARLASLCSRKGIRAVATLTICLGDTSISWILSGASAE